MSDTNLLTDWVNEQKTRLGKMLRQLDSITYVDNEQLELLGDSLEDIDFHCAALSNILDMIVEPVDDENIMIDTVYTEDESPAKRWPLLKALWFHMMMVTDPESIYYSPNICSDCWPDSINQVN